MPFPPAFLDELRARIALSDVVGRRVTWDHKKSTPSKGDYWACCPFHGEKSPSFHVLDNKGYFYCFGCHEKGSMFDFLMKIDNMSFPEAVKTLAAEAGLQVPEQSRDDLVREEKQRGLVDAMDAAVRRYREQLHGARAAEARAYLERRGLTRETIDRFELGFAPDARDGLTRALLDDGFARDTIIQAGLAAEPDADRGERQPYDRFRDRIMFPIRDVRGRCIAFGGRAMSDKARAKYLNSPETDLFHKGRTLYNHGPARTAAAKGASVIVVEGYMDVIALAQAGFGAAVAPLGTALTEPQLTHLWRISDEPIIALDGDAAGLRAAHRAADLALPKLAPGKTLKFALLPDGLDPDDMIRVQGASAFGALLDRATPLIDLLWEREVGAAPLDVPERRAAFEQRLHDLAGRIEHEAVRKHYQFELRERRYALFRPNRTDGPGRGGQGRGGSGRNGPGRGGPGRGGPGRGGGWPTPGPRPETLQRRDVAPPTEGDHLRAAHRREAVLLALLLNHPEVIDRRREDLERTPFVCPRLDTAKHAILSATSFPETEDAPSMDSVVAQALGSDAVVEIRAVAGPVLPRAAAATAALEAAEKCFLELSAFHVAELTWVTEADEFAETMVAPEAHTPESAAAADARLKEARRATHVTSLDDSDGVDFEETNLSQRLNDLVVRKPWEKRLKRP